MKGIYKSFEGVRALEFALVPHLSVAENIFIDEFGSKYVIIDRKKLLARAKAALESIGFGDIDPRIRVRELSVAYQQVVEICKALTRNAEILVLDEPTAVLTTKEVDKLFQLIQNLKSNGTAVIYVSHRLEEIFRITDRITVLKDGRYVDTVNTSDIEPRALVNMMIGRDLSSFFPERDTAKQRIGDVVLKVENISAGKAVKDVSFELREGEMLGLSGLVGAGRTEALRAVLGIDKSDGGKVWLRGKEIKLRSAKDAFDKGIGFLPEDRKNQGVLLNMPIKYNITFSCIKKFTVLFGWLLQKAEDIFAADMREKVGIKTNNLKNNANIKYWIVLALAALMVMAFSACTGTPADTGGETDATEDAAAEAESDGGEAAAELSSYDQIMQLLENPESALALSGIQPKSYESRADVPKGLPVTPKAAKDLKVAWAASQLGSSFFEGLRDSAQAEAKRLGMNELILQSADLSLETQNEQIDNFVTMGVDAILLNAVDLHAQSQKIKEVTEKGIPVIVTGPTAARPEYGLITAIISGSNESGFQVGSHMAEKLYKQGEVNKVGFVIAKLEDADSNSRPCGWIAGYLSKSAEMDGRPYESKYDAILEAFNIWSEFKNTRKYDLTDRGLNLAWLGVGEGLDVAKGQQATADQLTGNPDTDIIVAEMDSMGYGVIQECKLQGKTPGKDIFIACCADGTRPSLDYIKAGELMTTATNIPFMGATTMVDIVYDLFVGGRAGAPEAADTPEKAAVYYSDLPATSFTPTMAITAENVDRYYPTVPETDVEGTFAAYDPWTPLSVSEYNALHAND
jgi:ABC-type sugar transport system substrate-binding protein/ABC-type multidrug transport system ATPase subunit